jgi:hypothetical protein
MATVDYQLEQVSVDNVVVTWANLANGDEGQAFPTAGYSVAAVSASGTAGTGFHWAIEQAYSLDNPVWNTLETLSTIPQNSQASSSNNFGTSRPHVTGGDGTTDVTVTFILQPTANNT